MTDHTLLRELLQNAAALRSMARALVAPADADDLAQETALRVLRRPPRRPGDLGGFLRTILRRLASTARRDAARRQQREAAAARVETVSGVDQQVARREVIERLMRALLALPAGYRDVLLQRFFEDRSPSAIAAAGGVPVETIKTRLKRGLALLRTRLDATVGDDWRAALTGFLGIGSEVATAGGGAAAAATGAVFLGTGAKLAIVGAVAAVVVFVSSGGGAPPPTAATTVAHTTGPSASSGDTGTGRTTPALAGIAESPEDRTEVSVASRSELPRLSWVGAMPDPANVRFLRVDGALLGADGERLHLGALAPAGGAVPLLLRVDPETPFAVVAAVLDGCREQGLAAVQFAAALPDGRQGAFTLGLPPPGDIPTNLDLRLHRERPGVPPESAQLLLERMQRGLQADEPLVLGFEVPGDVPFEQALRAMSVVARAGVQRLVVRSAATPAQELCLQRGGDLAAVAAAQTAARPLALAMDLAPSPVVLVPPRSLPEPGPHVSRGSVGCTGRAAAGSRLEVGGGAGGRYGGRIGGAARAGNELAEAIAAGSSWVLLQQAADGGFVDGGRVDIESTALVLLTLMGDGSTMRGGAWRDALRRGVGWLLTQQRPDGCFGDDAVPMRRHALATYAMAEAYGLSNDPLLRGSLQDALAWMVERQQPDGGFGEDGGPVADTVTTALCAAALGSAKFFGVAAEVAEDTAAWFDLVGDPVTGGHRLRAVDAPDGGATLPTSTAAALFSRFFAGQSPRRQPIMGQAADLLLARADPTDPWCAYWTTYALYQIGGRHWKAWAERLRDAVVQTQITGGELAGTWDPPRGGSRLRTSTLRVLTLEAYYRYTKLVR